MEVNEKIHVLRKCELFSKISHDIISEIAERTEVVRFNVGEVIFKENDVGDRMYFINKGSVSVVKETNEGKEVDIAVLKDGDNFGEMAMLLKSTRTSTVRVREDCVLLELKQQEFEPIVTSNIDISLALNRILTARLASTLNIVVKQENYSVAFLFPEDNREKATQLTAYLQKISSKKIKFVDRPPMNVDELSSVFNCQNSLVILKLAEPQAHLADKMDYAVNFRRKEKGQFYIFEDTGTEEIERIGRVIAHKTVGIALGSGAIPAMSNIGTLKVLLEENIPIDYIAGCSSGAWCGAAYACGFPSDVIYRNFKNFETMMAFPPWDIAFKKSGIFTGNSFARILPILKDKKIEDCKIPFASVATDLITGEEIIIDKGLILDAIRASSSIPIFFNAVERGDYFLVDGVVTTPVPVSVLEKRKIDIKISCSISQLDLQGREINKNCSAVAAFFRSKSISAHRLSVESERRSDVVIKPDVSHIGIFERKKIMEAIMLGEAAGKAALGRINQLLYNT